VVVTGYLRVDDGFASDGHVDVGGWKCKRGKEVSER
jgi:hypothetical protein